MLESEETIDIDVLINQILELVKEGLILPELIKLLYTFSGARL